MFQHIYFSSSIIFASPLPVLAPSRSSWLLSRERLFFYSVLNTSYTVKYPFLNLYPAEEDQLYSGLGIYSGIFAIYVQLASKESRTATIIFYALCLLYVLSTATVVSDLVSTLIDSDVSNNSICKNIVYSLIILMRLDTLSYWFNFKLLYS